MKTRLFRALKWIACGLTLVAGVAGLALGGDASAPEKPDFPQGEICTSARD